jgi:hypothetical protein
VRIKFQVMNAKGRWRTAYCKPELLDINYLTFTRYGFRVRYFREQ